MSDTRMQFVVTHGKTRYTANFPLTSTLCEVKQWLEAESSVLAATQVLLLNAPVRKEFRRAKSEADAVRLQDTLPDSLLEKLSSAATPQVVNVNAMLIGTPQTSLTAQPMQLTSETSAVLSRLVSTTLEQDSRWYRCSYAQGYLRQTAYVCRTCVEEGRADPDHAVCLACTEVCHANHTIEEWGVRYHMRCDCCTAKCWRLPTNPNSAEDRQASASASTPEGPKAPTVVTTSDIAERTKRKRSRSRSPIKSPVGPGGSPLMGIRVPAVVNTPSPFAIDDPPGNEKEAVSSPMQCTAINRGLATVNSPPVGMPFSADTANATPHRPDEHTRATEQGSAVEESTVALQPSILPLPPFQGCRFILDSSTDRPPGILIPPNVRNRYPRKSLTWCYCEEEEPGDEESGGLVCMLCTSCFWNTHITSVHSDQFKRVPCYGDVVQGETVVFKCHTCNTHVCAPCRHRCHKDHEVEETGVVTSEVAQRQSEEEEKREPDAGETNPNPHRVEATPTGALFSCGCRGLCSIAETINPLEVDAPNSFLPFSAETTNEMMNSDIFSGFVCAICMQENPWLMNQDLRKCFDGQLPEKVTTGHLPILPCKATKSSVDATTTFPYHGMILPVNAFSEDLICSCTPCHEAFDKFVPWSRVDAQNMVMNLCDQCDVCHQSIRDKTAFMCQNCEMSMSDAFMLCAECNAHRAKMVEASQLVLSAREVPGDNTQLREAPRVEPTYTTSDGVEVTYEHDLTHQFMEDTQENLYALCGMQVLSNLNLAEEDQAYLSEHWDQVKDLTPEISLQDNFGPTPINFTQEDLREFAKVNAKGPSSSDHKMEELPEKSR